MKFNFWVISLIIAFSASINSADTDYDSSRTTPFGYPTPPHVVDNNHLVDGSSDTDSITPYTFEPEEITVSMSVFFKSVRSYAEMNGEMSGSTLDALMRNHVYQNTWAAVRETIWYEMMRSGFDYDYAAHLIILCDRNMIKFMNNSGLGEKHINEHGVCYDDTDPLGYLFYGFAPQIAFNALKTLRDYGVEVSDQADSLVYYSAVEGSSLFFR